MFGGYNENKLKPTLKMAVSRFEMAANKKTALMKQQMREISKLLDESPPKEEKARIRAEALIRDDGVVEAYEILQLTCELLGERIKLISSEKTCPDDLKSSISTLVWATPRCDIKELNEIKKQFRSKYGKKFDQAAMDNEGGVVNERIMAKLSVQPPSAFLVQTYLEKIADQFGVDWAPKDKIRADQLAAPMSAPIGYSVQTAPGTGLAPPESFPPTASMVSDMASAGGGPSDSVSVLSASSTTMNQSNNSETKPNRNGSEHIVTATVMPVIPIPPTFDNDVDIVIPPAPGHGGGTSNVDDDFDSLQARFQNLKR